MSSQNVTSFRSTLLLNLQICAKYFLWKQVISSLNQGLYAIIGWTTILDLNKFMIFEMNAIVYALHFSIYI